MTEHKILPQGNQGNVGWENSPILDFTLAWLSCAWDGDGEWGWGWGRGKWGPNRIRCNAKLLLVLAPVMEAWRLPGGQD